jgi:hypothetical protein
VEKRAGEGAVVDLKNLKSRHRSAIMASGFLLSAANGAFVSTLYTILVYCNLARADEIDVLHVSDKDLFASQYTQLITSPVYFTVVVDTSTSRAGMINSICGGLGLAAGSLLAGQYVPFVIVENNVNWF